MARRPEPGKKQNGKAAPRGKPPHTPRKAPRARTARADGPTEPSRPTVKRLFTMSGNRCAFPGCVQPVIDPETGSVIGEICHIKGENPLAARYDTDQPPVERQGFDNLLLMCGVHHKIVDDHPQEYPEERLREMKRKREASGEPAERLSDAQADRMIASIRGNTITGVSIVQTQGQRGGQAAHTINNTKVYNRSPKGDDKVRVEGQLSVSGDAEVLRRFGCRGVELRVVGRSKRSAKIREARLCVEGKGFVKALERGFASDFGHDPPEGMDDETLAVPFLGLSERDSPDGYELGRDDVRCFFLPAYAPYLAPFLSNPADKVSVRVEFFDGSERTLLRGEEVQEVLREPARANHASGCRPRERLESFAVKVKSKTPPRDVPVGLTNPNPVQLVSREQAEALFPPRRQKVQVELQAGQMQATNEATLGAKVLNVTDEPLPNVTVTLHAAAGGREPLLLALMPAGAAIVPQAPVPPRAHVHFALPFQHLARLHQIAASLSPDWYGITVRSNTEELARIQGRFVYDVVLYLRQVRRAPTD